MIKQRTNIISNLRKNKRKNRTKKFFANFIFVLFFISLANLGLTTKEARIKDVIVSGNNSVETQKILDIVYQEIDRRYVWIIPTDNLFLLRRNEIKKEIISQIKEIGEVKIHNILPDKIKVEVKEREPKGIWCYGTPDDIKDCYFLDIGGFVFENSPEFSDRAFYRFFGLITKDGPLGEYYLPFDFEIVFNLMEKLKEMSFYPKSLYALSDNEYVVYISGGGEIMFNKEKGLEASLINLQALADNKYIKTDEVSIKKIKYIDLRFGNKVNFELQK